MESDHYYPLIGVLVSLLLAYISFRYFLYYRGRIDNRLGNQDKNRRLIRWALIFLLISSLAFTGLFVNLFKLSGTAIPPPATATLEPGELTPTPSPSPLLVPSPIPVNSPTPEVLAGSGLARIGNTNSFGVYVRSEPGLKFEVLTQLSDGSQVELIGEAQTADGFTWQRVRLEDGRQGWIADNFLIPVP